MRPNPNSDAYWLAGPAELLYPEVEHYLNHVSHLLDPLPFTETATLRGELRQHLHQVIVEFQWEGMSVAKSVRQALKRIGDPADLAEFYSAMKHRHALFHAVSVRVFFRTLRLYTCLMVFWLSSAALLWYPDIFVYLGTSSSGIRPDYRQIFSSADQECLTTLLWALYLFLPIVVAIRLGARSWHAKTGFSVLCGLCLLSSLTAFAGFVTSQSGNNNLVIIINSVSILLLFWGILASITAQLARNYARRNGLQFQPSRAI